VTVIVHCSLEIEMKKLTAGDAETQSADIVRQNIDQLKALFPDAVTEGRIDFEVLKQLLGSAVEDHEEKYGLNWHGKRRARQLALTPSTGTLRPCTKDSVDWDTTQNLMIEGDNLEVLKLLQKSYAGKVKLIYIDPPYNTGKDFVYPDDYRDNIKNFLELTGQVEGGRKISSNTEASGRFHTDWLSMMYPRLKLARNLLREDGVIFITIDGGEASNLLAMMNEIFGEENSVVSAAWHKRVSPANDAKWFSSDHDLVIVYAKDKETWRPQRLVRSEAQLEYYKNPDNDPRGPWNSATYTCNKSKDERPNLYYPIINPNTDEEIWPKVTAVWKYSEDVTKSYLLDNKLYWGADGTSSSPRIKLFLSEMGGVVPRSIWGCDEYGHTQEATAELKALFDGAQIFDSPKPVKLLKRILEIGCSGAGEIVLDFFAGSGTTAHGVFERNVESSANLRFVLVQLPEPIDVQGFATIVEITKERIRRAAKTLKNKHQMFPGDLGFRVFKLDSSNIRAWEPDRDNLDQTLLDHQEHVKADRTEADILYELLLKLGLDLCVPIEKRVIAAKDVHAVGVGVLLACLAEKITREEVEPLAQGIVEWHKALAPAGDTTCVFRDSAFADDVAKTNLAAILQQHGLQNVRSL
jgi:adenine-specific DNA-methyltransferase